MSAIVTGVTVLPAGSPPPAGCVPSRELIWASVSDDPATGLQTVEVYRRGQLVTSFGVWEAPAPETQQ